MSKDVKIALVISENIQNRMFTPRDLETLKSLGNVAGPVNLNDAAALAALLDGARIAVTGWGSPRFDAALLAKAPDLRMVAHTAGTVKGIVSDELYDRGIVVTTSAAANAVPVAQYTVAMMVSLLKQVPWLADAYNKADQKEIERRRAVVRELEAMRLSIIGASRVGREVIKLLKGYPDLEILCYDPYLSDSAARELGVIKVSLEEACRCELVSIHAPSIPETRHMFNARTLALLPDHAVLINTSRGALIDEAALVAECARRPLYVMLDVTDPEPMPTDSPLRKNPNIIVTPHIAGAMNQACKGMGRLTIGEIRRFLNGEKLQHAVTRDMLATQA